MVYALGKYSGRFEEVGLSVEWRVLMGLFLTFLRVMMMEHGKERTEKGYKALLKRRRQVATAVWLLYLFSLESLLDLQID
jgi:hypothetical protein